MNHADHRTWESGRGNLAPPGNLPPQPARTGGTDVEGVDLQALANWIHRHIVVIGGTALIVALLAWRAQFLSHEYFRQDDFFLLDLANRTPFTWSYLTYIGSGHLMIGPKALIWLVARVSGYDWRLVSAINLVMLAAASVAALRLLRTLFGDRPAILIPLAIYLLTPLTLASFGWWSAAIESVPLQLAIFMALNAHVQYIRTNRARHIATAAFWVAFGMIFFEKGLFLPLLLFGVTSAFLVGAGSWLAGVRRAAATYWRAWAVYAALMAAYSIVLARSLSSALVPRQATANETLNFAEVLVKDAFVPGALGGPWTWFPTPDGSYALAAPPAVLSWLSLVVALAVIGVSIARRQRAWRAWVILAGWIMADMLPVIVGRLSGWPPVILGLETRYVADAAPVLAICLGLAFWPTTEQRLTSRPSHVGQPSILGPTSRRAGRLTVAGLALAFVIGSIWSGIGYEHNTSGSIAAAYIKNARSALEDAPPDQPVLDSPVPNDLMISLFGNARAASILMGPLERGSLANKLRWMTTPVGTVDNLMMFGPDGRLHLAVVYGAYSPHLRARWQGCWPGRKGRIIVPFATPVPASSTVLRIAYLWRSLVPGLVAVNYGNQSYKLPVRYGLHAAYLHVTGSALSVTVDRLGGSPICIGNTEAGTPGLAIGGPTIPAG